MGMAWLTPPLGASHTGTTDTTIFIGSGYLLSYVVTEVAAGAVNIRRTALADGSDLSGEPSLVPTITLAGTEEAGSVRHTFPGGVRFEGGEGLGIELTATGITVFVTYCKDRAATRG